MSLNQEIRKIQNDIKAFAKDRDWEQFHSPKNIAMALSVETSELLELFQWLTEKQSKEFLGDNKEKLEDEVADVFYYLVKLADLLDVDFEKSLTKKMIKNKKKYPASLVKGSSKKYDEY